MRENNSKKKVFNISKSFSQALVPCELNRETGFGSWKW